jgi:hypothetical protein
VRCGVSSDGWSFAGLSALVKAMRGYKGESARTIPRQDYWYSHWRREYRYVGIGMWPTAWAVFSPRGLGLSVSPQEPAWSPTLVHHVGTRCIAFRISNVGNAGYLVWKELL